MTDLCLAAQLASVCALLDEPLTNIPFFPVKRCTDADDFAPVGCVGGCVSLRADLIQRLLRRSVQLKLENVDGVPGAKLSTHEYSTWSRVAKAQNTTNTINPADATSRR